MQNGSFAAVLFVLCFVGVIANLPLYGFLSLAGRRIKAWIAAYGLHTGHMIKGGTIVDATIINAPKDA